MRKPRTDQYKWRNAVLARDRSACQLCGEKRGRLDAHHIKSYLSFHALRSELSNGITLCHSCHLKVHMIKSDEVHIVKIAVGAAAMRYIDALSDDAEKFAVINSGLKMYFIRLYESAIRSASEPLNEKVKKALAYKASLHDS